MVIERFSLLRKLSRYGDLGIPVNFCITFPIRTEMSEQATLNSAKGANCDQADSLCECLTSICHKLRTRSGANNPAATEGHRCIHHPQTRLSALHYPRRSRPPHPGRWASLVSTCAGRPDVPNVAVLLSCGREQLSQALLQRHTP
jgi:hypothetical protein